MLEKDTTSISAHHRAFYTGLAPAREEVIIYTNSKKALPQAVNRQTEKSAAVSVVRMGEKEVGKLK
jgi:hypothetical protein